MRQYETTFIINPALSGDEIEQTANMYIDYIKNDGSEIVHVENMGVKQLAYPIRKRTSGAYYWVEFKAEIGSTLIEKLELAFRRDENILRYLTLNVDKNRAQYNLDKRAGKFEKKQESEESTETAEAKDQPEVTEKAENVKE
jgi:small subunit ribosomal protein S6